MSLAGFSGALADKGGPYSTRAATLAALTLAGAVTAALGAVVGEYPDLSVALVEGRPPALLEDAPEPAEPELSPLLRGRLTRLARQLLTLHDAVARLVAAERLENGGGRR
jgi:hypothetical protein